MQDMSQRHRHQPPVPHVALDIPLLEPSHCGGVTSQTPVRHTNFRLGRAPYSEIRKSHQQGSNPCATIQPNMGEHFTQLSEFILGRAEQQSAFITVNWASNITL